MEKTRFILLNNEIEKVEIIDSKQLQDFLNWNWKYED